MYEVKGALFTCCLSVVHAVFHGVPTVSTESGQLSTALSTACRQAACRQTACRQLVRPAGRSPLAGPRREPPPDLPYPPRNKPENTIAPFYVKTYHGFMTTWQALKRAGYMHPDSSLDAALFSNRRGVVAV